LEPCPRVLFSRYLLVGNYLDQDFSIFRVNGAEITDIGKRFKVPGHPASARMGRGNNPAHDPTGDPDQGQCDLELALATRLTSFLT
jgi:hypothetical protein